MLLFVYLLYIVKAKQLINEKEIIEKKEIIPIKIISINVLLKTLLNELTKNQKQNINIIIIPNIMK